MRKFSILAVLAMVCTLSLSAAENPVPAELFGAQTVGVVNVNLAGLTKAQIDKTVTAILGQPTDPNALAAFGGFQDKFKAAGGLSLSVVINVEKDPKPENADKGIVLVIKKGEGANPKDLAELMASMDPKFKDDMAPDCPKEIKNSLVWYNKNFKLPEENEDRAKAFSAAFEEVSNNQAVTIVVVPDEDAVKTINANLKPDQVELLSAILGGSGICLFTDFGIADAPNLKILIMAADVAGAEKLQKATEALLAAGSKDAPPPLKTLLDSLKGVQAGSNVQIAINIAEFGKAAKELAGPFLGVK